MSRQRELPARFWIEAVLAAVTGLLFVVTLISREWIELLTDWDLDRGSGALEWAIVIVIAMATVVFGLLARAAWRRAAASPAP
jgi:hypothetical protein